MTIQLMMPNGMRFAIDADAITAVEESPDETKAVTDKGEAVAFHAAIVWAGGHRFVTATAFDAVYETWLADLELPEDDADETTGDGAARGVNTIKTA